MPATIGESEVFKFVPRTLSDSISSSPETQDNPAGSCQVLQNLVPDRATPGFYAPRPALTAIPNLAGTQSGISAWIILGSRIWYFQNNGSGSDVPKCWDTSTGSAVVIGGSTTYPSSPTTSGQWTPPDFALVGTKIMVCHPGLSGGNYIGWIDVSNPASPTWNVGDLTGAITFTGLNKGLPTCVQNFNGRAYYSLGNSLILSDSLVPTNVTNASQALTVGDNQPITSLAGQPFMSTTSGGIVQALAVFKNLNIFQVTGDPVFNNLSLNAVNLGVGTQAPLTVVSAPEGTYFMAADGIRVLGLDGQVSDTLPAVKLPFDWCASPSRACAAYADGCYRISLTTPDANGNNNLVEYVFDKKFGWHGPHTSGASLLGSISDGSIYHFVTYNINQAGGFFGPYYSNMIPHPSDAFTEYGATLQWELMSANIPSSELMDVRQIAESTLQYVAPGSQDTITVQAISPENGLLASAQVSGAVAGALWGAVNWGAFNWNYGQQGFRAYTVPWPDPGPFSFKEVAFTITGTAALKQRIGWLSNRVRHLPVTNLDLTS